MVDLTKNEPNAPHGHITMLTCYLRAAIDEFSEEHRSLNYGEIVGALEMLKFDVLSEASEADSDKGAE